MTSRGARREQGTPERVEWTDSPTRLCLVGVAREWWQWVQWWTWTKKRLGARWMGWISGSVKARKKGGGQYWVLKGWKGGTG